MKARASRKDLLASGMDEETVASLTRKELRGYVVDRRRVGRRTGHPVHFLQWKAEGAVKSALQRMSTETMAVKLDGALASAFALLAVGGIRNVWDVANKPIEELLAVKGIGLHRLSLVEAYLKSKDVSLTWTVEDNA